MAPTSQYRHGEGIRTASNPSYCFQNFSKERANRWIYHLGLEEANGGGQRRPVFKTEDLKELYSRIGEVASDLYQQYSTKKALEKAMSDPNLLSERMETVVKEFASKIWGSPGVAGHTRHCTNELDCGKEEDRKKIKAFLIRWAAQRAYVKIKNKRKTVPESTLDDSGVSPKRRKAGAASEHDANDTSINGHPLDFSTIQVSRSIISRHTSIPEDSIQLENGVSSNQSTHNGITFSDSAVLPSPVASSEAPDRLLFDDPSNYVNSNSHTNSAEDSRNAHPASNGGSSHHVAETSLSLIDLDLQPNDRLDEQSAQSSVRMGKRKVVEPDLGHGQLQRVTRATIPRTNSYPPQSRDVYTISPTPPETVDEENHFGDEGSGWGVDIHGSYEDEDNTIQVVTHGLPPTPFPHESGFEFSFNPLHEQETEGLRSGNQEFANATQEQREPTNATPASDDATPTGAVNGHSIANDESFLEVNELQLNLYRNLLECVKTGHTKTAKYEAMLDLIKKVQELHTVQLSDDRFNNLLIPGEQALTAWVQLVEKFCAFRQDTGFDGRREDWGNYCVNVKLDKDRKIATALQCTEMKLFKKGLENRYTGLNAKELGKCVAPVLYEMTGSQEVVGLEELTGWICDLCNNLFIWFK